MNNIQVNGQRRWGPPENWSGPPPVHGTEIFVKNLPKEVFEQELYNMFSKVGSIYEVRLPVNWNGSNKGYAFLRFMSVSGADRAISFFDNFEIRNNRNIRVLRSIDNKRLFLSAVPVQKNAEELKNDLLNYVENIKKVYVYPTLEDRSVFRGYAFVEFETHRDAAIAKRILTPDVCFRIFQKKCVTAWANSLPYLDQSILNSLSVLFMRNIPKDIKSIHLKQRIETITKEEIQRIKILNDFAFLTYRDHKSAQNALNHLENNPCIIPGQDTQVEWAIPRDMASLTEKKYQDENLPKIRYADPEKLAQKRFTRLKFPGEFIKYVNSESPEITNCQKLGKYRPLLQNYKIEYNCHAQYSGESIPTLNRLGTSSSTPTGLNKLSLGSSLALSPHELDLNEKRLHASALTEFF